MKKKFKYFTIVFTVILLAGAGCKKFLDVNKNVNSPTPSSVQLSFVLSAAERSISNNLALGSGLGNTMAVYTHQITGRVGADRYGAGEIGMERTLLCHRQPECNCYTRNDGKPLCLCGHCQNTESIHF